MGAPAILRFPSFALATFLIWAVGIHDAAAQWTYRAAPEPLIRNISVFAGNPVGGTNTLIVSTQTDGMYRGTDTGTSFTWTKINTGIPTVQVRAHFAVTPSPITNPVNDIYAATDGAGVYRTTNGGSSWSAINGNGLTCMDVRSISVTSTPPTTYPRTLLASTSCRNNSGVFRGIEADGNNPVIWTRLGPAAGLPRSIPDDVHSSSINRSGTLYFLATSNYGIFKSTDDGANWDPANAIFGGGNLGNNVFNTAFSGATGTANLLAYVHGSGMFRSSDTGATWIPSNGTSPNELPTGFAALGGINRQTGQTLFIGLDKQGVYKTIDGGLNWLPWGSTANDENGQVTRTIVAATPASPTGQYYLGTLSGVIKTSETAQNLNGTNMPEGGRINAITHDRDASYTAYITAHFPLKVHYIYGDYNSDGMFASLGNGVSSATSDGVVYQDRYSPATPAPLYVTTNNRGIFKSINGGTSFTAINNGLPSMIGKLSRLAFDPTLNVPENSKVLYLGLNDAGGLFKSTDGGATWLPSSAGLSAPLSMSVNHVTVDGNNPAIVWIATGAGVFKSVDSGASWTQKFSALDGAGSTLPTGIVRVRSGNSNEIYIANNHVNANGTLVAASSGILKSTNGGDTWTNILPNQKGSQVRVTTSGDIYAGVSAPVGNPAVYLSTNGGTSFTAYSTNLQGSDIRGFGIAANESAVVSLTLENGFYTHDAVLPPPTVTLSGAITEAPGIFSRVFFGYQTANTTSASKAVTITNTSLTTASIVAIGSNSEEFAVQSHNCPVNLAAGASCTANVTFTPRFNGTSSAVLSAIGPVTGVAVNLFGYGIQSGQSALVVSNDPGMVPAYPGFYNQQNLREITFGNQGIGTTRTISVNLLNAGTATATINFNIFTSPGSVNGMTLGGTCGTTIPAGGSCRLDVTYAPTVAGITNQTLNINHNSPPPIQNPSYPFLLYGVAESTANDGSLIDSFGATTNPGGAGKAFVSFGPYGVESVERLALQADGKIIVFMSARKALEDGIAVAGVARLNADGTLDTTWGASGYVRLAPTAASAFFNGTAGVHIQASGKVIVAYASATGAPNPEMVITRLDTNGLVDATFGTTGSVVVPNLGFMRLESYADGRMLATGNADPVNNNKVGLVRLSAEGVLDVGFGTAGRVELLVPDAMQFGQGALRTRFAADGKIFVAYSFGAGSARDVALYKLTTAGAIDTSWGAGGRVNIAMTALEDNVRNMRVQSDGKILLLSRSVRPAASGTYLTALARLNADGSPDTLFGTAGLVTTAIGPTTNLGGPLLVMADGKVLVGGRFNCGCLSGNDGVITRYNPDGSLDTSFGMGGTQAIAITVNSENIGDMHLLPDGTIVAGGQVSQQDVDRGNGTAGSVVDNGFVVKVKNTVGTALVNLTVTVSGSGSVTSLPAGIICPSVCVVSFAPGSITLTAATGGGSTFAGWSGGGCSGTGTCVVTLAAATSVTATFTGGVPNLLTVLSRKVHGSVGTFELPVTAGLPINGAITIEPRTIGSGHQIVFQFDQPVATVGAATTTAGIAAVSATGSNDVVVTLTNVPDNQRVTVTLTTINGTVGANALVSLGFLVGDMNGTQRVNASDISAVRARASGTLTLQNFVYDLNASGAINAQDTSAVKARSGLVMP